MIQAIRAMGGHPRYTELPQAGHDIWLHSLYITYVPLASLPEKTVPDRVFFQGHSQTLLHTLGTLLRKYWLLFIGVGVALRLLLWMYTIRQQQGRAGIPVHQSWGGMAAHNACRYWTIGSAFWRHFAALSHSPGSIRVVRQSR